MVGLVELATRLLVESMAVLDCHVVDSLKGGVSFAAFVSVFEWWAVVYWLWAA